MTNKNMTNNTTKTDLPLKVAINKVFVGSPMNNAGKTTVMVDNLLALILPDALIMQVESVDEYKRIEGATHLRSHEIGEMAERVAKSKKHIIVDSGSSVKRTLFATMKKRKQLLYPFTHLIIPVTPDSRVIRTTRDYIASILESGVEGNRIHVVLNKLDDFQAECPESTFGKFEADLKKFGVNCNSLSFIEDSDIFELLSQYNLNIIDALNDKTPDYQEQVDNADSEKEQQRLRDYQDMQELAPFVAEQLRTVGTSLGIR